MANTFTTNYDFVKSEIGGDNQSWGDNLHTTLNLVDIAVAKAVENQLMSGITSTAFTITAGSGTGGVISTAANLKYFESVVVGDKIRISTNSATNAANGTPALPVIYTVTAKTSADSITLDTQMVTDTSSSLVVTVAKVLEPVHINSGPIICAPLQNLSATTRTAAGVGVPGSDTTDALVANGDVNLAANVILGGAASDTVTFTAKVATDIIPSADASYDLGASGSEWQDLHIDGTANIDGLVANETYALSGAGTIAGCSALTLTSSTISMSGYTIGSNAKNNRTVSTDVPPDEGSEDGDIHYRY